MVQKIKLESLAQRGLNLFFSLLLLCLLKHIPHLFLRWEGYSHRLAGACHLSWLLFGISFLLSPSPLASSSTTSWMYQCVMYDIILGVLGTLTTLTAARDFPHRRITNAPGQSGTLSHVAIVTQNEMIEHSFYQGLNLVQALYLHGMSWWNIHRGEEESSGSGSGSGMGMIMNVMALWVVTSPWLIRKKFPVHSFSANWTKETQDAMKHSQQQSTSSGMKRHVSTMSRLHAKKKHHHQQQQQRLEKLLYQIKKWQYIFYKHVILHGLNLSVAFPSSTTTTIITTTLPFTLSKTWRFFWICLNTSYVMEFFMQTLVKRHVLSQSTMLWLQRLLIACSSIAAILVLPEVRLRPGVVFCSVVLNFVNRGHDVFNTVVIGGIVVRFILPCWL